MAHTGGTWRICKPTVSDRGTVYGINGYVDSSDGLGYRGECRLAEVFSIEANAVLMAAAPELLKACKLAAPWLAKAIENGAFLGCSRPSFADKALAALEAAIAKAEGVTT